MTTIHSCQNPSSHNQSIWTESDREFLVNGLEKSRTDLIDITKSLSEEQWHYRPDSTSWSIAEIVEHLGLQQDNHFREVYVLSKTPPHPELVERVRGNEDIILSYASDTTKGKSTWNVEPQGRWCTKEDALSQFNFSRDKFIEFVQTTNADLKQHFTFRSLPDKSDYRNVRDLHQIILTTITHTSRHVHQIESIIDIMPNIVREGQ